MRTACACSHTVAFRVAHLLVRDQTCHAVRAAETKPGTSDRSAARLQLLNHEQSPWRGRAATPAFQASMAALQGPSRAQAAQALDFALEPKGSPCTRALGWPGWSLEGKQSMLTMARLTVALLPTNMLRGMLHGEGDKPAAATSAAARHARLRCEEHARLRGGAREAHVPFTCSTYAFACQYTASTPPVHVHTRRACSAAASL